jgi:hypothetical protein
MGSKKYWIQILATQFGKSIPQHTVSFQIHAQKRCHAVFSKMVIMNSAQQRRLRRALRKLDYEILVDAHKHCAAGAWCQQQFGKRWEVIGNRDGYWCMFWAGREAHDKYRFCFAREEDALIFTLKWL